MPLRRPSRLIVVFVALVSLLFMQWAVAGYSCPGNQAASAVAMAEAGMPCADSMTKVMDSEQPGLCLAHCQAGDQSADSHQVHVPVVALDNAANYAASFSVPRAERTASQAPLLTRSTAPPLTIRNCCFRI